MENPNLDKIHADVLISDMANKDIQYCRYDKNIKILECHFNTELSTGDKVILDNIINN